MPANVEKIIRALEKVAIIDGRREMDRGELVAFHAMSNVAIDDVRRLITDIDPAVEFYDSGNHSMLLVRKSSTAAKIEVTRTHIILFAATMITTLTSGALMAGTFHIMQPWTMLTGWPFSLTLMGILGFHEFGHYYYARRHKVDVTLPYFIPVPPPITLIGTFGAFIRMRGPIPNRRALLEIGAAGPIAGFIIAVPALFIGLWLSDVVALSTDAILLGESLMLKIATGLVHPGLGPEQDIMLHPVGFAGWIGLLVTMLNLLPMGQLDGGHITYALLGDRQELVGKIVFAALIPMGIFFSLNWLIWGLLILVLMRTVKHPAVPNMEQPLSTREKVIGIVCLVIFILCFLPAPIKGG